MERLTLDEIVGAAGLDSEETARRRRRFVSYQERGLLGAAIAKEHRRGGAGLWHPAQGQLWDLYERQRADVRPMTLANAPVGSWLLRQPGISLDQAKRAFQYWLKEAALLDRSPAGERSDYRKRLHIAVDNIAHPGATRVSRLKFRRVVSSVADSLFTNLDRHTIEQTLLAALTTGGTVHPNDAQYASNYSTGMRLRSLVIQHLDTLLKPKCDDLWLWMREHVALTYPAYQREQPLLRQQERTGRFHKQAPDLNYFVNESCAVASLVLGTGIDMLSSSPVMNAPGFSSPPASLRPLFASR